MDNKSYCKIDISGSDIVIVSFGGYAKNKDVPPQYNFYNFIEKNFPHISRYFCIDDFTCSYHKGIKGKTTNIPETVEYLKNEIKNYKRAIFIGISSGGYAAILFGSLLEVSDVIAFIPQTILRRTDVDENYRDISNCINDTTKYHLYGDLSISGEWDCHHIHHCERISHYPNVFLTKKSRVVVQLMRETGELYTMMNNILRNTN